MRFRATVVVALLGLALLGRPAKADSFHVTGATDPNACATRPLGCSDITYALDFTTDPPIDGNLYHPGLDEVWLIIDSISGQINGTPVSCIRAAETLCGDLLASRHDYTGPPIPDGTIVMSGALAGLYGGNDSGVPLPWLGAVAVRIDASFAYTTWNVSTPEPSTVLFLGISLLGLLGFTLPKNRLS